MREFQKGILAVLKSGLTGERAQLGADFPWERAAAFVRAQSLDVMFFCGLQNSHISPPEELYKMQQRALMMAAYAVRQECEAERLFALLKQKGLDFLPLKGAVLKNMYPQSGMRYMGDIDVLIKEEQYSEIETIMRENGYAFVCESNHEYVWDKRNTLHVEFHKRLIPSYNKDYFAYYGDGWRLAHPADGSEYAMTDEDFLIYIFTHLAKHYRDSGIGLKHFIDIWVYLEKKSDLDMEYVRRELEKLQLSDFFDNVLKTLGVWFDGREDSAQTEMITEWTFASGTYGSADKSVISAALRDDAQAGKQTGRIGRVMRLVFAPYEYMCKRYAFLKKIPCLLPVMWLVRIAELLLLRRDGMLKKSREIGMQSDENVDGYRSALKLVGLEFNFKE